MSERKRHLPDKYKPGDSERHNFAGTKPLWLFRAENGLWGVKDGAGKIEIEPEYVLANEQTYWERKNKAVRLISVNTVLCVTPDDWDVLVWISDELTERDL